MAFGIKYYLAFDVVERPQGITANYSMTFSKEGYSGAFVPLRSFGSNAVVAKISNDSVLGISTKKLDIEILEDTDISELQTAYPREWKVEFVKTVGTTTTLEFAGWLMPTSAQTEYKDGSKYVRLEASDGLANLKNFPFVDDSDFYYGGVKSVFEIIRLCLEKTGLSLKINIINNTFANGNDTASTGEAMKQRYLDMDLFRGENEPLNTYNVLQDMINTESCRLYQEEAEWWIENITEKKTGFVIARKYQSNGTFISGDTLNLGISAVHNSNYQPFNGGLSNVMPVKWVKVEHKLAKFKNRILNRDLRFFSTGVFGNWTNNGVTTERVGDGTTGDAYGIKINGFESEDADANDKYIYQTIAFPNLTDAINFNLIFKGQAFIKDLDHTLIECELTIDVESFEYQGVGYPAATNVFGLSESGEWVLSGENLILENKDINGFAKKTVKTWDITSKRIGGITFTFGNPTGNRRLLETGWQNAVTGIYIKIKLKKGVGELEPYPGETKASSVIYKNLSLAWVNADTNLNLKEIYYKATQPDYAPNDETIPVIYGDYIDGSNLSAIKDVNGNTTSLWTSEVSNTLMNFHKHGAMNLLRDLGATPKVYDGSIRGLIRYRNSVAMAGITNRGYITSYTFNYARTEVDVRIVEHGIGIMPTIKKIGVLSDGTEIAMSDDSPPSPVMGNGVGGGGSNSSIFNPSSWIKQLLSGIQQKTNDNEILNVFWGNIESDDAFDFGSIVRRDEKLLIGSNEDTLELGKSDSLTTVLGRLGIRNTNNFFAEFSVENLTSNRVATLPDRNIEINKWSDLSGVPTLFSPAAHTHQIGDVTNLNTVLNAKQPLNGNLTSLSLLATNGIVRRTGANTFVIGTNDPITLTGDITGNGTTTIPATLSTTGVVAGIYKSVTVDAKGRVTAGTLKSSPNYLSDFGFQEDFARLWNISWIGKIDDFVEFGSDVQINGGLGIIGNLFLAGNFFDKNSSIGLSNQVLMPVSSGGVAWTSLSTAQISNFSANVLGQVLTGFVAGSNTPLLESNTILTAFQNLQAQITAKNTAERLVFGEGFFQNNLDGNGFEYKTSAIIDLINRRTGSFLFTELTADRSWELPDYNGTLTTYEKIDAEFWKLGGNGNITANAYFNIVSKYDDNSVQQEPYSYVWAINGEDKMQLTPQGNLSVGGIAPEAVIHAHATVVGNAEVYMLKASNNQSSSYFSISIDSTNNRTNFYAGGEVWATSIPKFKFAAADVSGLWTYSVIPQTTADATTGNQLVRLSQVQTLLSGGFSISTTCVLAFITNQTLSGAKTQGGYTTVAGDSILLTGQSAASANGVYVFNGTIWVRNTANDTDSEIRGKGHLILFGTYASTQWVNNNALVITVGVTAITYAQWSGAELDPVWNAYKNTHNLTPTRFSQWDSAYSTVLALPNNYQPKLSGYGFLKIINGVIGYDPYLVGAFSNNEFTGQNKFTNKLEVRSPMSGTEAVNADYVDSRITAINIGFWPKINANGIGTTTNTSFDVYTNNVKAFEVYSRVLTGLRQLHIRDGVYTPPFATSLSTYYGLSVADNAMLGYLGGASKPIYSLDLIRGNNTNNRSGVRFGRYLSGGDINLFAYGIEYSTTENLQIGFYDSNQMNGAATVLNPAKSLIVNSSGFVGFGKTPQYRADINGDINLSGVLRINGNAGSDHFFLKSLGADVNGAFKQEWAIMNCGEIADIYDIFLTKNNANSIFLTNVLAEQNYLTNTAAENNYIKRVTDEGERGFYLYGDAENTLKDGFVFSNPDTGVLGIHQFRLNGSVVEQYGFQLDKDGLPYWLFADGSRKRILTTNDATGGGGTPVIYTLAEPLYFQGSQINIRTASATQNGVLSKEDWTKFNTGIPWNGGVVTNTIEIKSPTGSSVTRTSLKFSSQTQTQLGAEIYLSAVPLPTPGLNLLSNTSTDIALIAGYDTGATTFNPNRGIYLYGDSINLNSPNIYLGNVKVDMSTYAVGRYLRATSSTKAEWVTI